MSPELVKQVKLCTRRESEDESEVKTDWGGKRVVGWSGLVCGFLYEREKADRSMQKKATRMPPDVPTSEGAPLCCWRDAPLEGEVAAIEVPVVLALEVLDPALEEDEELEDDD